MADIDTLASASWKRMSYNQRKAVLMVMSHLGLAADEYPRARKFPKHKTSSKPVEVMCETIYTANMDTLFVSEDWLEQPVTPENPEDLANANRVAIHGNAEDGIITKVIYAIITMIENETSK